MYRIIVYLFVFHSLSFFCNNLYALQNYNKDDLEKIIIEQSSINDLVQYASQFNPDIISAKQAVVSSQEKLNEISFYPDPDLSITFFTNPIETRLGPQDYNASISQKIPFPGKISSKKAIYKNDLEIARLKQKKLIKSIILSIKESAQELHYIRKAIEIARHNSTIIDHLRKIAETGYVNEKNILFDVIKAQSQTSQIRYDIMLLKDLEQNELAQLNSFLNRSPDASIGPLHGLISESFNYSLNTLYELTETNNENICIAELNIKKAENIEKLSCLTGLPDFKLGFFYAGIGIPDVNNLPDNAGDDAFGIKMGLNLPLWYGKNKSIIARAKALSKMFKAQKNGTTNKIKAQIRELYFRVQNAKRLETLYKEHLIPQAVHAIEIAEIWFQEGESSFSDFLETQAVWYNFQLALARARADYGKYFARLENITGTKTGTESNLNKEKNKQFQINKSLNNISLENSYLFNKQLCSKDFSAYTQLFNIDIESKIKYSSVASSLTRTKEIISKTFSIESLESLSILRNPSIIAAEKRLKAQMESFSQISYLDEILIQFSSYTASIMTNIGPKKGKNLIQMKFPFPGITSLKGNIALKSVESVKEKLFMAQRDTLADARIYYWDLFYIHQSKTITNKTLRLLRRLEQVANTRYKTGKTNFQDVIKVRIKRKLLEENLKTLNEEQINLEYNIREILNLSPNILIGKPNKNKPDFKIPDINLIIKIAQEKRQELRQIRSNIAKAELMIELSETMIQPSYVGKYSFHPNEGINSIGTFNNKENFSTKFSVSKGYGLPKNSWHGINDSYLRQARLKKNAMKNELESTEAKTISLVRKAWFKLDQAIREAKLYKKEILSLSKSALDVSSRGYESGNVSFADVINSYMNWLDVNIALERKYRNIGIAKAKLLQVIGTDHI